MTVNCPHCQSTKLQKRGTRTNVSDFSKHQTYSCSDCNKRFSVEIDQEIVTEAPANSIGAKKFVFTSAQNDTPINREFLASLESYCGHNDATLYVLKSTYNAVIADDDDTENYAEPYMLEKNIDIGNHVRVYAALNILATAENPLAGLDGLSKGKTLIIGHASLQMKTLPVFGDAHPLMLTTTGTISHPNFSNTKAGFKAEHNHSYSAIILEVDGDADIFHIRVLKADSDDGFYDLDKYYASNGEIIEDQTIEALVLGDTHVTSMSQHAYEGVYGNYDSMVNTLRPRTIVHHDLLDFGVLQSHHNAKRFLTRYSHYIKGLDDISEELNDTVQFLEDNTPDFVEQNIIVASNHCEHIETWLNNAVHHHDYKNAKLYHYLMFKTLDAIEQERETNPFQFYFEDFCKNQDVLEKTRFLGRDELYFINDILVSSHGDIGTSGSRFTPTQGKNYPHKMIVGHSHSPSISKGCYTTGTMTPKLDYTKGSPSGWMNTMAIIHKNGERQLVSVVKGKWRL